MNTETLFKAMADSTRRKILQLVAHHELSVSDLVDCLSQPQSTVSRHLKVLRNAALINDRRDGTTVLYAAPESDEPRTSDRGDDADRPIASRLLEWIGEEPLPIPLERRLDRVLNQRRQHSTEFFARVVDRWDQMRLDAFGHTFHLEALTTLLPREWVVADIGTGTGYLLPALAASFRRDYAVDPVPRMLEVARARCDTSALKNVIFRRGDLGGLPIKEKRIDLATAVLVLHHVPAPVEALGELARILKPEARLMIVEQKTHNIETFHERMQDRWWGFEPVKLARDVTAAGFECVHWRDLPADTPSSRSVEAPELFVLTARRNARSAKVTARK